MTGWKFHGRENEIRNICSFLQVGPGLGDRPLLFGAGFVMGRRGTGKTSLVEEVLARHCKDPERPGIIVELEETSDPDEIRGNLRQSVVESGFAHLLEGEPPDSVTAPPYRPRTLVEHLLGQGAILILDEFHHAALSRAFLNGVRTVINRMHTRRANKEKGGKLLLVGSHQQKMASFFQHGGVLSEIVRKVLELKPWGACETMEMATESGLLQERRKFLSMWTACGGTPREWERMSEDAARMEGAEMKGDDWHEAFVTKERRFLLENPRRLWNNRAYVSLGGGFEAALRTMAESPLKGFTAEEIVETMNRRGKWLYLPGDGKMPEISPEPTEESRKPGFQAEILADGLDLMEGTMSLVESGIPFGAQGPVFWRISDAVALFQLHVCPEFFSKARAKFFRKESEKTPGFMEDRLSALEGLAFERLGASWISEVLDATWEDRGATLPGREQDVDVLAEVDGRLSFGFCKKNGNAHRLEKDVRVRKAFEGFLKGRKAGEHVTEQARRSRKALERRRVHMVFSLGISEGKKQEIETGIRQEESKADLSEASVRFEDLGSMAEAALRKLAEDRNFRREWLRAQEGMPGGRKGRAHGPGAP